MINKQTKLSSFYWLNTQQIPQLQQARTVKAINGKSDILVIILCIPWLVPGYLLKRYSESFCKIVSG